MRYGERGVVTRRSDIASQQAIVYLVYATIICSENI
jgi:hypothetical protein